VEQSFAALAHPDRVRTFRIATRKTFPETDVQKPELNPLTGFGPEGPAAFFPAGVVLRIHRRHQELARRSEGAADRRRDRRRREPDVALARPEDGLAGNAPEVEVDETGPPSK